LNIKL